MPRKTILPVDWHPDRTIRNARLAERQRRNNSWGEAAVLSPRLTDAQLLMGMTDENPGETQERERILRRLCAL